MSNLSPVLTGVSSSAQAMAQKPTALQSILHAVAHPISSFYDAQKAHVGTMIKEALDEEEVDIQDLLENDVDCAFILAAGVSLKQLIENGGFQHLESILNAGVPIKELEKAGISLTHILQLPNISLTNFYRSCYSIVDLLEAQVSIMDLLRAGASIVDLVNAGVTRETISEALRNHT